MIQILVDGMREVLLERRNRYSIVMIAALIGTMGLVSFLEQVRYAFGYGIGFLFTDPIDLFGDLIKSALSYKSIVGGLINSPQTESWPELYRTWLVNNPYNGPVLTHYHLMPLTSLFKMVIAEVIVLVNPAFSYVVALAAFVGLVWGVVRVMASVVTVKTFDAVAIAVILVLSHPALFALTRGNMTAGYMSMCLVIYVLSCLYKKHRNLGLFCLAAAINIHPTTIAVGVLEFVGTKDQSKQSFALLKLIAFSFLIGAAAYVIVHAVEPAYTVAQFFDGYHRYTEVCSEGNGCLAWNSSLFGLTKVVRLALGITPGYSLTAYMAVSIFGIPLAGFTLWLLQRGCLTRLEAVFLGISFYVLFTPVFALYHMLDFAAPLIGAIASKNEAGAIQEDNRLVFKGALLSLCCLGGQYSNGLVHAALLVGFMFAIFVRAHKRQAAAVSYAM